MKRYRVHFENVGLYGASWTDDFHELDCSLLESILQHGSLNSRSVDFEIGDEGTSGEIYVGARPVGTLRIEKL